LAGAREQGHQNSIFASAFRFCIPLLHLPCWCNSQLNFLLCLVSCLVSCPAWPACLPGCLQEDLSLLQQFAEDDAVTYKGQRVVAQ
jgi:hypothetical protein